MNTKLDPKVLRALRRSRTYTLRQLSRHLYAEETRRQGPRRDVVEGLESVRATYLAAWNRDYAEACALS